MALTKRLPVIALAVVAMALTLTGIVIAATDSNPSAPSRDPLVLNGYPPTSATLLVTVSTGQSFSVNANVKVDFVNSSIEAAVKFPLLFSVSGVDLRFINGKVYVGSALVPSGINVALPLTLPQLYGFALEMTKPDIALITGLGQPTVTASGYTTTYDFHRNKVPVSGVMGSTQSLSGLGALDIRITVGSQGEVTGGSLTVTTKHETTTLTVKVLAYNQKMNIAAPPASQVTTLSGSSIQQLLKSLPLSGVLMPQNLSSLGQLHLN